MSQPGGHYRFAAIALVSVTRLKIANVPSTGVVPRPKISTHCTNRRSLESDDGKAPPSGSWT